MNLIRIKIVADKYGVVKFTSYPLEEEFTINSYNYTYIFDGIKKNGFYTIINNSQYSQYIYDINYKYSENYKINNESYDHVTRLVQPQLRENSINEILK